MQNKIIQAKNGARIVHGSAKIITQTQREPMTNYNTFD